MGIYASDTTVSVEKSRSEIERTLMRFGASAFGYANDNSRSMIRFQAANRHIMFVLELPDQFASEYARSKRGIRDDNTRLALWERDCRSKWRALALAIKAKLAAVDAGISSFEEEFMAHVVMPNGKTIGQVMKPQIESAYSSGKMPPLLGFVQQ